MKPFLYSGVILVLILGGCSTAYQTGRTPDDVYYSPAHERTGGYASSDASQQQSVVPANDNGSGNYVTYSDGNNSAYNYNSAAEAYDYGYNDPYYSPYYGNYYLNQYYSPYSFGWYPSFSLGLGFGYPWMYNYFSPWGLGGYNPYYSYWGGGYYPGFYYSKYYSYTPRPANSYGPRVGMSSNARVYGGANTGTYTNGSAPVRTFNTGTTGGVARPGNTYIHAPRRVFVPAPDERPVNVSSANRSGGVFRIFRNYNNNTYRPEPVNVQRPVREFQPARTFEPQRTESAPVMNSSPAPVRTFSPRSR